MIVIQAIPEGRDCCGVCVEDNLRNGDGQGVEPTAVVELSGFGADPLRLCATHWYQALIGLRKVFARVWGDVMENEWDVELWRLFVIVKQKPKRI